MRCVIFDLDGTLADTSGDLIAAANACFRDLGHGELLDPIADAATAMRGGRAMLRLGFERVGAVDEAEIDRQFPIFVDHYSVDIDRYTTLYPGAMETVDLLRDQGFAVGICTNKPGRQTQILLERLDVWDRFDSIVAADTLPVRKPDPAPFVAAVERAGGAVTRALLVGDTVTDHSTARAAGVPSVLVTFSPAGRAVADLQPDALLDAYKDLPDLAARLLS